MPETTVYSTNIGSPEREISEYVQRLCKIFFWAIFYVFGDALGVVFLLKGY
jgi:hypothetical protein